MYKPILCLDFDGVIHSYTSGWKGADNIPDPPVDGAILFISQAITHFRVAIFSSRSNQVGGLDAMKNWLSFYARVSDTILPDWIDLIEWPIEKPAAFVTIDDRAITFTGVWPDMQTLLQFKPWNKK